MASPLALPALEVSAQAGVGWTDNLSRTSALPYRKDAATYAASVSVRQGRQITRDWQLFAAGEAGVETVPKFNSLDATHGGLTLQLRRKFGLGAFVPVLDLNAGATYFSFHESGRSGWKTELGLTLSQRLTETWRVSASGGWQEYYAQRHTYDLRSHQLAIETSWDATERWRLSAGAQRLWGELTANTEWDVYGGALAGVYGPRIAHYYSHIPWAVTNTFGPGWTAYRVDCVADFWWLQASFAIDANTSIPIRYEAVRVVNRADVRYDTAVWSLGIAHRF
ncbi:MAG: hypothetical protein HYV95_02715 [Opitutae bacterium]|nr:hypothetical protein [Opitutae bacterium]